MKRLAPFVLVLCAIGYLGFSFFGDESYDTLEKLEQNLEHQRVKNLETKSQIEELKKEVFRLQHDERTLEKAARNELGMSRHGELIFVFDHYIEDSVGSEE